MYYMLIRYPDVELIKRGVQLILERQLPNGDFPLVRFYIYLNLVT